MIPGSTHGRESAEWTSDARFERHVRPVERHEDRARSGADGAGLGLGVGTISGI
ncbi:MAG: hypothetical protein ABIQ79_10170 [Nitrospiraceae bacterium]